MKVAVIEVAGIIVRYNLAAATQSQSIHVSFSNFDRNDERVTCSACRFRYPHVRRFCPICGMPAPADEAIVEIRNKANGEGWESLRTHAPAWRAPAIVVCTALMICIVSYLALHGGAQVTTHGAAATGGATSTQSNTQAPSPAMRSFEESLPEHVDIRSPKTRPAKIVKKENDDPVELWSRVRQGSAGAEVALARLYLEGTAVARSCEQAHVLLLAASRKQDKEADGLLAGAYAQHCQ